MSSPSSNGAAPHPHGAVVVDATQPPMPPSQNGLTPITAVQQGPTKTLEQHIMIRKLVALKRLSSNTFSHPFRRRARWVIMILIVLVQCFLAWIYFGQPRVDKAHEAKQETRISALESANAQVAAASFPSGAATSLAWATLKQNLSYNDQAPYATVTALKDLSGWQGVGVANLGPLTHVDPDPARTLISGDYMAVPFSVDLINALQPAESPLYYVLVVRSGGTLTARNAGVFFVEPPRFIAYNNQIASSTAAANEAITSSIQHFLAGETRYTLPNQTIAVSNGNLTPAGASDFTVYQAVGDSTIVTAKVTYKGPTKDAVFIQREAFDMRLIGPEWRVSSLGLDANLGA
jgi:hypothetical protein